MPNYKRERAFNTQSANGKCAFFKSKTPYKGKTIIIYI